MKHLRTRLAAFVLALMLLCSTSAAAADPSSNTGNTDATIDINTQFDMIMQFIDWYGIEGDNGQVLRNYFDQYFKAHPEEYVSVVNDILQSMDPYSHFMTKTQYNETYGQISQTFYGIGITFDSSFRIVDAYTDGAAYAAGVHVGDVLLQVDGKAVAGRKTTDVITELRGTKESPVTIVVSRGSQKLTFTITRRLTTPHHVYSQTLADGVAYVRVAAMGSDDDSSTFTSIWNSFAKQHIRAAILDLRGNGGGLVNMASSMIETVVPQAKQKYMALRYNTLSGGLQSFYTPGGGVQLNKLVILTDSNTASAAEIVSGSLSDLGVATLLGDPTYGKGVGQYHFDMGDTMLILTAMEIQLPVRGAYNGHPLQPDLHLSKTTAASDTVSLPALNTHATLVPGMKGNAVSAMTARLKLLSYLSADSDTFDATVLQALRQFQADHSLATSLFATPETLATLDSLAQQQAAALSGMDNQLSAALALCKTAAARPAQYTVHDDGTWTNLSSK